MGVMAGDQRTAGDALAAWAEGLAGRGGKTTIWLPGVSVTVYQMVRWSDGR
jgi:hypothetical protein